MSGEEKRIELEFKASELSWRSNVQKVLDEILAAQKARVEKYDAFIDILIAREKARGEMRKAIIEKTLAGLVYSCVAALVAIAWAGMKTEFLMLLDAIKTVKAK